MELLNTKSLVFYMKYKGIEFKYISEYEAINILDHSNYYYKLNKFLDNYITSTNVDFKHLVDLSSIDMQLRYNIMKLSLDIEHSLKVYILRIVTQDSQYDGTGIVSDFLKYYKNKIGCKNPYYKIFKHVKHDNMLNDEYNKYENSTPIWYFIEYIQFGTLCMFIEFLYAKKNYKVLDKLNSQIKLVKNIRNKAAHNTPILNNIVIKGQLTPTKRNKFVVRYAKLKGISKKTIESRLTNFNILDMVALFSVYDSYVTSSGMKYNRKKELRELLDRAKRNKHIYDNRFESVYNLFNKIVESL